MITASVMKELKLPTQLNDCCQIYCETFKFYARCVTKLRPRKKITLKYPECYKNVFESIQGGTFKLANTKHEHRTTRQSGRTSQSFLSAGPKFVYTCTKNFCVDTRFSLACRFQDKIKSL